MNALRLKVPPVIVVAIAAILLLTCAVLLPGLSVSFPGQKILALAFIAIGLVPGLQAVASFRRRKTTVNPMTPTEASTLVTDGIYHFTRNPMYLGLLCLLIAIALLLGTLSGLIILPAFVWYMTEFQIKPEEDSLRAVFGPAYEEYLTRVRRWI